MYSSKGFYWPKNGFNGFKLITKDNQMHFIGFTAMFCTYYVIDVHTGKVISVVVANKRQARMVFFENVMN